MHVTKAKAAKQVQTQTCTGTVASSKFSARRLLIRDVEMNTGTKIIAATILLAVATVSSCSKPANHKTAHEDMASETHNFSTPEGAFASLIRAYQSLNVESIVKAKDFDLDSRLFWEDLGLPVTDDQRSKSTSAFESNFRKQLEEDGIPDYRDVTYAISGKEKLQSDFIVLTVVFRWQNGKTNELRIPTVQQGDLWKVVLSPGYDHL